jgi:hypothetical protein
VWRFGLSVAPREGAWRINAAVLQPITLMPPDGGRNPLLESCAAHELPVRS